jgi:hypothetical protein
MKEKKHNYLYKVTCNIDNTIYIGVHSTDNLNDGYKGSGTLLKRKVAKHGWENFTKEILQDYPTRKEMLNAEKEHVNDSFLKLEHVMNLVAGGGGWQEPLMPKAKRGYTIRNPSKYRRYTMYDAEYIYKLNLRCKEFKVYGGEIAEAIGRHLINEIPFLFKYLNEMYNQKETHDEAEKFINKIYRAPMFHNNLYIEKRKRQLTLV